MILNGIKGFLLAPEKGSLLAPEDVSAKKRSIGFITTEPDQTRASNIGQTSFVARSSAAQICSLNVGNMPDRLQIFRAYFVSRIIRVIEDDVGEVRVEVNCFSSSAARWCKLRQFVP